MDIKGQVQSQMKYAQTHKGKAIGSVIGLIAGISFGMAGKKDGWMVTGIAIAATAAGTIIGGMFEKQPAIVVPVPTDVASFDKTRVVNDTAAMENENDTAGLDGASNFGGRRRKRSRN